MFLIYHFTGNPSRGFFMIVQGHIDNLCMYLVRDLVPIDIPGPWPRGQAIKTPFFVFAIPIIECALMYSYLYRSPVNIDFRSFHKSNNLVLFLLGKTHIFTPFNLKPVVLFLSTRFCSNNSATASFSSEFTPLSSFTSFVLASRMVSPIRRFLPASRKSLHQR